MGQERTGAFEELLSSLGGCPDSCPLPLGSDEEQGSLPPPPPGIELQNIKPLAEYKTAASIRLLGNGLSHDLHGSSPALLFHVIPIVAWDKNHRDLAGVVASFLCLGKQHVAQILKWLFVSPPFGSGRSWL